MDDDPSVCRLLQVGLARRGFEVVLATSSQDALRVLETAEVDVVLTDVLMEGTDGLQLCARIVAERLVASNGAWYYTVALDGGATVERPDYELRRRDASEDPR